MRYQNMKTCNSIWISFLFEIVSETLLLCRLCHVDLPVFWWYWPRQERKLTNSCKIKLSPQCRFSDEVLSASVWIPWFTWALGQASSDRMNLLLLDNFFFPYHYLPPSTGVFITLDDVNSMLVRSHLYLEVFILNIPLPKVAKKPYLPDYNSKSCIGADSLICLKCFYFRTLYLSHKNTLYITEYNNRG